MNGYTYSFKSFQAINFIGKDICNGKTTIKKAGKTKSDLSVVWIKITAFFKRRVSIIL